MKKLIVIFSIALLNVSATTLREPLLLFQEVYICDSKNGKKYHFSKSCRGLNACKATIKKLKLAEAKKSGKTICGWED